MIISSSRLPRRRRRQAEAATAGAPYPLRLCLRFIKVLPALSSPLLSKQTTSEEPELPIKEDLLPPSRGKGAPLCRVFSLCGGGSHERSDESALPFLLMLRSVHPVIPYQPDEVPLLLTGPRTRAKNPTGEPGQMWTLQKHLGQQSGKVVFTV